MRPGLIAACALAGLFSAFPPAPPAAARPAASLSTSPALPESVPNPPPDLLVSARTARLAGLEVGDVVRLSADPGMRGSRPMRVAGILPAMADPTDVGRASLWVKLHFSEMQALLDRPDEVDAVVLKSVHTDSTIALRDRLNALGMSYRAYGSQELARRSSQTFQVIALFHEAISAITLAAGMVFLLAILLFKVEERKRELGALRLIGIRRRSLLAFLCLEAFGMALGGSLLGVFLGRLAASGVNAYYQHFYDTTLVFARLTPRVLRLSLLLGVGFGTLAGLLVALRVVRTRALELLGR